MANPEHPSPYMIWNKLLHGEIKQILTAGMNPLFIKSQMQPGKDGGCIVMLLLLGKLPSWYNIPCQSYSSIPVLICKRRKEKIRSARHHFPIQNEHSMCGNNELLVFGKCIQYYWGWQRQNRSQTKAYIDSLTTRYLVRLFSYITWHTLRSYQLFLMSYLSNDNMTDLCIITTLPHRLPYDFVRGVIVTKSACKLHVNGRTVSFGSNHDNHKAYCQHNQVRCTDGTCVSQDNLCFGNNICLPHRCLCHTNGKEVTDRQFCSTSCRPGRCFCPPQHFQCTCGGCIQMNLMCDGVIHCPDASDEICKVKVKPTFQRTNGMIRILLDDKSFCLGQLCLSGKCIYLQQVNDLFPDCPGHKAEDEPSFLRLRYYNEYLECTDSSHIPCVAGLSVCYPIDKICLFDRDQNGNTRWCRDGSHLGDCAAINCTNSFKCPASYCIPFHRVCDGGPDCIHAEDEASCDEHLCKGLLRCTESKKCVHPVHICDGINQCPNADDEQLCDVMSCPPGCDCLSHSIICTLSLPDAFPLLEFSLVKHLSVIDSMLHLPNFSNICDLRGLIFMNLSANHLKNICGSLQFDQFCQFYKTLVIFDLSHNDILHVRSLCFSHLHSLKVIYLSYNPLHILNSNAFSHPTLTYISLRGIQRRTLAGESLRRIPNLYTIDITEIHIESIDDSFQSIAMHIPNAMFNDMRLCCIFAHHKYCSNKASMDHSCPTLLPHAIIGYMICPVGVLLVMINLAAFSLNYRYMPRAKYHGIVSLLMFTDAILASYLAALGMADILYRPDFVFTVNRWGQGIFCAVMIHMTTMATLLSLLLTGLLLYYVKQAATQITWRSNSTSHNIVLSKYTFLMLSKLLTVSLAVTEVATNNSVDRFLCNRMGDSRMRSTAGLTSIVTFSVLMIILTIAITTFTAQLLYHVRKTSKEVECISGIRNASSQSRAPLTRFMLATVITKWATLCPYPILQLARLILGNISDEVFLYVMLSFIVLECFSNPMMFVLRPLLLQDKWYRTWNFSVPYKNV